MAINDIANALRDAVSSSRVFGDPVERDGVTVLPVARICGGGGGGEGTGPHDEGAGSGGGLGFVAEPAGAWVLRDGHVSWQPALDLNRVILGGQIVAIVALLVVRTALRRG